MINIFRKDDVILLEIGHATWTEVIVLEVKAAYGKTRYVVAPTRGKGKMTVESSKLRKKS